MRYESTRMACCGRLNFRRIVWSHATEPVKSAVRAVLELLPDVASVLFGTQCKTREGDRLTIRRTRQATGELPAIDVFIAEQSEVYAE